MKKEKNYQFRERMMQVHRPGRYMPWAKKKEHQIEFTPDWVIYLSDANDTVLYHAARDLEDYFAISMGLSISVVIGGEIPAKAIIYTTDSNLKENEYRFFVSESKVEFCGSDARAAAQAGYFAEDLMNLAEGPFLDLQDVKRCPLYSPRMVHSGAGMDFFPEEHIRNIAHKGINAILVYVDGPNKTPYGYQDFNDLATRAARWGVDVYAYSHMKNRLYPEGEEGERYYDNLYGELFRRCPGLKGIVFVGEACEFPSRDDNTSGRLRLDNLDENGRKIINKPNPGWWPCYDYPIWLNMVKKYIRKYNPEADIVLWSYNWGWAPEEKRLELIRSLPQDISLLVTFEMFEDIEREGVMNRTVDYTLFFEGPGQYFVSEAKEAKKCGIRLYAMTNTGGLTWDIGTVPYEPAPYQWMRRYQEMRYANENWGLCGTMDSHHFGFYPSFISDLAKWAFHRPTPNLDEILRRIAVREFSEETADKVLEAWKCFSDGIRMLISTDPDQYGPFRVGPSYPLLLFNKKDVVFPSYPYVIHGGNSICEPMYSYDTNLENWQERIHYEMKCHAKVAESYDTGCALLEEVIPSIDPSKQEEAQRMLCLGKFIANTARTTVHVKQWYVRKLRLQDVELAERQEIALEMKEIALAELENAKNTIPLVEFDSRLGFEPSMEYMCDKEHLEWKIHLTERVLREELSEYLELSKC